MARKRQVIDCPKCGFQFDILYARTVSCQSCDRMLSSLSCEYIRCPKCGFEFKTSGSVSKIAEILRGFSSIE
ncbi:MAG: hypothetical protein N3E47_05905 [Candidatus Bathyarchaeota archaeon]|nr:hypothetical protein [Candidatus Bathyarchaeota archaeon]